MTFSSNTVVPVSENDGKSPMKKRKGGISATAALINLLKGMTGPGCLSLPLAFKQSGLWTGFILMILFGFVTYFSFKKIVNCSQYLVKLNGLHCLDYGTMAEESFKSSFRPIRKFATSARYFVNFSIFLMQMGICSVFVIFIKEHLHELTTYKYPSNGIEDWMWFLAVFIGFTILCLIRSIKIISVVSMFGNIFMASSLVIIIQALVRSKFIWRELPAIEDLGGVVMAAGSILYAFEGQAMILPMENKMKYPHEMMGFNGVLSTGCSLVTLIYLAVGFYGYITYGKDVQGSITLNLPDTPVYFWMKIMLTLVVFTGYLIQQFVIVDMLWPSIKKRLEKRFDGRHSLLIAESLFKTFLVVVSLAVAIGIPNLGDIIPLIGVTAGMSLALIIPAIVETTTFLPKWIAENERKTMIVHMFWNVLFFASGVFFLVTGVVTNFQNILTRRS